MKITKCEYGVEKWCCKTAKEYIPKMIFYNNDGSAYFDITVYNRSDKNIKPFVIIEKIKFCPFCGELITIDNEPK